MRRWGLWTALLAGCSGAFADLPAPDQERWQRCAHSIMSSQCGPDQDAVYRAFCARRYADEYAESPPNQRAAYLVGHGCPRDVAEYRAGSSGGSAPASAAPVAAAPAPLPRAARIERRAASGDAPGLVRFVYEFPGRVLTLVGRTGTLDPPVLRFAATVPHAPTTRCDAVSAMAGTVALSFQHGEASTRYVDGGSETTVTVQVTAVDAATLANAQSVSLQLCDGGPAVTLPAAAIDTLGAWHREWAASRPAQ